MKFTERLRHYWHELYNFPNSNHANHFAMSCLETAEKLDLGQGGFRLRLHLSLCQACHNYYAAARALRAAVRKLIKNSEDSDLLAKLNQALLKKHSK